MKIHPTRRQRSVSFEEQKLKSLSTTGVGEEVQKQELFCLASGTITTESMLAVYLRVKH